MNEYTASNGIEVAVRRSGISFDYGDEGETFGVGARGIDALREFFRAERDEELGRWRSPEHPDFVVYPKGDDGDRVAVLNEKTVLSYQFNRGERDHWGGPLEGALKTMEVVADAYFDAHPEPKPWHDAKPGEVWAFTYDGTEDVFFFLHSAGLWYGQTVRAVVELSDPNLTAGRRLWPERVA